MTGFARSEAESSGFRWVWELKSVNGRGLDIRLRMPAGFDSLEPEIRKRTKSQLARGSVSVGLAIKSENRDVRYRINRDALDDALAMIERISIRVQCAPPQPEGILALRGVIEPDDENNEPSSNDKLFKEILVDFDDCLKLLLASRRTEGTAMASIIADQVDALEGLASSVRSHAEKSPDALRERLLDQVRPLLEQTTLAEDRVVQEVAIMASKADIREEIDRLDAHISAGRELLRNGGAIGRQLDFLTQEFNREANTLCSKAADITTKKMGLEMKSIIDQLREQVQNIE
ncbi:MAG: YicC/YloC family endoribonuclease [Pseudomonadota bacterium]